MLRRLILALAAAFALGLPGAAAAQNANTPFGDASLAAITRVCMPAISGRLQLTDNEAVGALGYTAMSDAEEESRTLDDFGRPELIERNFGANDITVAFYNKNRATCVIGVGGPDGIAVQNRLFAAFDSTESGFTRDMAQRDADSPLIRAYESRPTNGRAIRVDFAAAGDAGDERYIIVVYFVRKD